MAIKMCIMGSALPLLALTLAGCGSNSAPGADSNISAKSDGPAVASAAATHVEPCGVLSTDAVAAITGDKIARTEVIDHDCLYHTTLDDDGTRLGTYLTDGKEQMDDLKTANKVLGRIGSTVSAQGDVGKDVQAAITPPAAGGAPALGDEAIWGSNDVLAVRKGDVFVQATPPIAHDPASHHGAMLISDTDRRAMAQKLVKAALAKLAP